MKIKLQLGIFVLLLAFLGTYVEHSASPNQQIIIQFSDANISSEDAEHTVEIVKQRLQRIGVTNIKIGQHVDGQLKIIYYSDADIARIKNILFKEDRLKFTYKSNSNNSDDLPKNRSEKDYKFNISEIQNSSDINWDFEGVQIVKLNQKRDRFDDLKDNNSGKLFHREQSNTIVKVAIQVHNTVARSVDKISYKIPEVRAGPSKRDNII